MIGVIGAASYGVDFVAAALGTKQLGASPRAMIGAGLGTIAGLFFGLPGIILGPFVGAVVGELTVHRDLARAGRASLAAWIGFVVGMAVKVGLAFLMLARSLRPRSSRSDLLRDGADDRAQKIWLRRVAFEVGITFAAVIVEAVRLVELAVDDQQLDGSGVRLRPLQRLPEDVARVFTAVDGGNLHPGAD